MYKGYERNYMNSDNTNTKFKDNMARLTKFISGTTAKQRYGAVAVAAAVICAAVGIGVAAGNNAAAVPEADLSAAGVEAAFAASAEPDGCWGFSVNGEEILCVASEEEAAAVFQGVTDYYSAKSTGEVTNVAYGELVEYTPEVRNKYTDVMSVDEAVNYVVTGAKEPVVYVVQSGDNTWDIAMANGISEDELLAMNPGVEPKRLQIGQELNLYESHPFMTVSVTENVSSTEKIAYNTVYQSSDELYKGQTSVQTPGVYGSKEVTTQLVRQNGIVVASNVINEVVLSEPQDEIALKGTKAIQVSTGGSGTLAPPMSHIEVSDVFGASRGSTRRHAGVDLRNPKGTPIYASDAGTVIFSGTSTSYGKIVKIDHGGGLQTYYAHCDELLVNVGDQVQKGEQIATVGRTGNATGYILHFEVRVNGVAQNPMNYI